MKVKTFDCILIILGLCGWATHRLIWAVIILKLIGPDELFSLTGLLVILYDVVTSLVMAVVTYMLMFRYVLYVPILHYVEHQKPTLEEKGLVVAMAGFGLLSFAALALDAIFHWRDL